ncbi:hypothetical protein HID58_070791 [Brassica napus]|uniref:Uncharacterized protein n=1 Tax=Brassica napus TaxID=3708 RepID=A0ABQ7YZT2_BRANA|nr:hypothetical protein HID58_070791 [Brassica napus]
MRSKVLQWRICTDLQIGGFESVFSHFLGAKTKDSQDRIRSFWTRKKDLQDEVVKNNPWSFEVSNCGTTRKDWKFKEDLCHAFIALKGLRSEPIAYREFECGWKTRRLVFWYKF